MDEIVPITIRLPKETHKRIVESAKLSSRSINSEIIRLLSLSLPNENDAGNGVQVIDIDGIKFSVAATVSPFTDDSSMKSSASVLYTRNITFSVFITKKQVDDEC